MKGKWKQRILAAILSIAMFFSGVAGNYIFAAETESSAAENGNSETFSGAGEGTQENPYIITNAQQMHEVRYNLSAYYVLGNDIDLSGIENWEPIGDAEEPFKGSFDGNNKTISGMHIEKENFFWTGLFGWCNDYSTIKNVILENVDINVVISSTQDKNYNVQVGTVAAVTDIYVSVSNCSVSGTIGVDNKTNRYTTVGGIVGNGGTFDNCINRADIRVTSESWVHCGGIAGQGKKIDECRNYGNISAIADASFNYCGGISGEYGVINSCINYGSIYGETTVYDSYGGNGGNCNAGGIVGATINQVIRSANYGDVESYAQNGGTSYAGGIAGYVNVLGANLLTNCINAGNTIVSVSQKKNNNNVYTDVNGDVGRIARGPSVFEECYSLDTTTCNGTIPTEHIGADDYNGASLDAESLEAMIQQLNLDGDNIMPGPPISEDDIESFSLPVTATNILTGNEVRLSGRMQFTDILSTDTTDIIDTEISSIIWKSSDEDIISSSDIKCVKSSENATYDSCEFSVVMPVRKCGEVIITGTTRNGVSASTKVEVFPKMTLNGHDVEAGENIYRHVCTVTLDSPDESFLEQFMPKLQIDRYILNENDFISGSTGCETTKYIISEHGKTAELWTVFRSVSVGSDSYSIKYNGCTETLGTFSVQSDKQNWSDVKANENSKINEDQSQAYNEIQNAIGDFRDKVQEFIEKLQKDAEKKGGNVTESSEKDLAKKLEECGAEIKLTGMVFEDEKRGEIRKKFIYKELADKLASIANATMGSIKLSDKEGVTSKNILDNVVHGYHYIDGTVLSEDKKMELAFDITGMYNAYFGQIWFTEAGTSINRHRIIVNMTQQHLVNVLQQYTEDLARLSADAGDVIYSSMAKDLLGKSISDFAGDRFEKLFGKYEPQLEKWGVKGMLDFAANCYTVYEKASAVDVDKILNNTDVRSIAEELEKVQGLLDIEQKGFTNKAAKTAGKKVVKAAEYLYKLCRDYAIEGKVSKKYSFSGFCKHVFGCPVEVFVYDADGKQIGYAGEDDLDYDPSIMIEEAGEAKIVYVPLGKEVSYKINGTGYGVMNCSFEEYDQDGMAVGRLNYYDIELTPESKIEAVIPADGFILSNSSLPVTVNGVPKTPDVCLEAKDYEFMDIKVTTNDTDGGVFRGAGKYVPGDVVNLIAVPNSGYVFTGWYDGSDNLVNMKRNIEFAARNSGNYIAKFMKLQEVYTITYNLDGGTVSGNPDSYTEDTLPVTLKEPVRSGYVFLGWTGSNGTTPQKEVTIEKGSTGEKFYTANWTKSNVSGTNPNTPSYLGTPSYSGTPSYPVTSTKYAIIYNLDGGTVSENPDSYTQDMLPVKLKEPARNGYTFLGWTGSNGTTPQKEVTIEKGSTGEKFYTANWIKNDELGTNSDAQESKSISHCVVTLSENSYTYDGKEKMPGVTVRDGSNVLMSGTDYTVSYGNNTDAGTASLTVKGAGSYAGEQTVSFIIRKASNVITAANIKRTAAPRKRNLSIGAKDLAHAGLSYKSNHKSVKVSKAGKVTIAKNFVGSAKITITAAETANYAKAVKKIKVTVKPARVKLLDVKNLSGNRLQVCWKKNTGITAYQIQCSASKKFNKGTRTITVPKKAKTSAVISKMKEGKKYYVRIRAYKNISGKIYRSKWSSVKSAVTEK